MNTIKGIGMTSPFRLVDIEGEPFERGYSYGSQTRDLVLKAIDFYTGIFAQTGMTWDQVKRAGQIYAERLRGISEPLFLEIEGIAQGAGVELGEIVALNARTELRYGGDANKDLLSGEGCTGAIAVDTAVKNGRVIHGQNWDWLSECAEFSIVLRIKQKDGPTILTLVEAGTLARCGLNSAGIAITG
jgi:isopenicillin-N N-acyltransferase-like protein